MTEMWDKQMKHPPTKMYYDKLKEIISNIIPEFLHGVDNPIFPIYALEIGLDVGISARCILEFPNIHLTSVDPGEVDRGIAEIGELKAGDRWTFHHMPSDKYFEECKKEYDIIYIDGDHSYEQTKRDVNNAWKFIKEGGVIIGHDFLHKKNFYHDNDYGVTQAFCEFIIEQNCEAYIYPPNPGLITIKKV
jgi:predicted O-methyltransferase YrrM